MGSLLVLPFPLIVWRFAGDGDAVRVALDQSSAGDAGQARFGAQVFQRGRAGIAHARAQPAHQLVDVVVQRPLVGQAAFYAFRHQLAVLAVLAALRAGIAVLAIALHGAQAAHAAILLEAPAFV